MIVSICLSELYFKTEENYVSESVSYNFFKNISEFDKVFIAPVGNNYKPIPTSHNSVISRKEFIELPFFDSIKYFGLKYYLNRSFRLEVDKKFIDLINDSDIVWARNPSLASIIFSELALKHNKKLISHICADIESTWNTIKYKGVKKILAFFMSKFILYKLKNITKHQNTYTLCTGSKLYNQFSSFNKNINIFTDSIINENTFKTKKKIDSTFLYVGRLSVEKGILDLIEACKILEKKDINFSLDIIGFGSLEVKIKSLIQEYKLSNNINFIGSLPYEEVQNYYEKNSIFILPSYREGFPRVILEAWAHGMPVITTNVGGIKGLGQNRKNLLFVKVKHPNSIAKTMEELIINKQLQGQMQNYIIENRNSITFEYQKSLVLKCIKNI